MMRALPSCSVLLLALVALPAACSDGAATLLPASDGYGPAGGGAQRGASSSGSSSGGSTPPPSSSSGSTTTPPPPPAQPAPEDDAGVEAGTGSAGWDAGATGEAGRSDSGASSSGDAGDVSELLALCAGQVNDFRVQNGVDILVESSELESYAATAAASDARSGQLHGYFNSTGGGGVASTEDELDGSRFDPGADAEQTMEQGLQDDEDSNGNAAANLLDQQFNDIGCGFGQDASGNWWVVIALR
jgi:uncharacterized protein YkwD